MNERAAGILMPISSLPSEYGIGCFSKSAYEFVDWLKEAGQSYWQILPLGPTSYGDSPYQSFSTFAGNPYFISLDELIEEKVLTREECDKVNWGTTKSKVDYEKIYKGRYPLLRKAYERSNISENPDYQKFVAENNWWLADYALFMAVKARFDDVEWTKWAEDIRLRWNNAMDYYREELYYDIEFQQYMQFKFHEQWMKLKNYANSKGIKIIGDIPIYVAMDSADAWAHPELFQLDSENVPVAVAGCPPDGFSATGQLWGNPLYRWDYHRSTGYEWWISRLRYVFNMYDVVRIDHFRGFDEYFSIPYEAENAIGGHWEKGPGIDLFRKVEQALGWKPVIAEDLGYVTDSVRDMVRDSGFPGMKVLEFAFDSRDSGCANDYLPHNYPVNSVAYTGTHDNETIVGWWSSITKDEQKLAREYLCDQATPDKELYKSFISLIMRSSAKLCVIPMQDYLGLDNKSRINTPSTVGKNWKWRINTRQLSVKLQKEIYGMVLRYGRMNWNDSI
ncbi:4-alpha-glucanotransferase [Mediterraneibacter sp. NSJ-151]|nr:4-alpha-glucanotransferase [Mediterraneibacter sp. NSJ-151]MCH4280763.1 4-alpha-glucanotransferase [Mediterraneibacter sp. NSJ-151]